jgi:adenylate cyclase
MRRHIMAASIALATAVAGLLFTAVPPVSELEDSLGLRWLFQRRGHIPPPPNVIVVDIDDATAARLGLPPTLRNWPRSTHGRLLDRLVERGASAIAFDIAFFSHSQSADEDRAFSEAVDRARRVVLIQQLDEPRARGVNISRWQHPIPPLAKAARGLAPVPLPRTPVVASYWTFINTATETDRPTLPAVLLQIHGLPALESFVSLLARAGLPEAENLPTTSEALQNPDDLLQFMRVVRRGLQRDAPARAALMARVAADQSPEGEILRVLADLYGGNDRTYLNFYGPPGTICTVRYDAVILGEASHATECDLRGAIVLVGAGRGRVGGTNEPDTYHTVLADDDSGAFSGVEIHATAVANLLTRRQINAPRRTSLVGLLVGLGAIFGATGYYVRTRHRLRPGAVSARLGAALVLIAIAALYAIAVETAFERWQVALPLIVPLAIQLPSALILGLIVRPAEYEDDVEAVCLATDAADSTALGQRLPHDRYARLLDEYNRALCGPVRSRGGSTLEPQGDGFVCLWCLPRQSGAAGIRLQACVAALEIAEASMRFDLNHPDGQQLPTRVGLNVGRVTIYSDADRGVFKAFGDAVNVAARLRDLNVSLGTRVLAGDTVVEGLGRVLTVRRFLEPFALKGVSHPISAVAIESARFVPLSEARE